MLKLKKMSFTSFQIKEKARELGFRKLELQKQECPDDQNNLNTWLEEDRNGTMVWINKRKEEREIFSIIFLKQNQSFQ